MDVYANCVIEYGDEYVINRLGKKRFTCRWIPANVEPKALVFLCHGYGLECSVTMREAGAHLANVGFAVYGMDYEGHGKSDGLRGYIHNWKDVVNDCYEFFTSVCERKENKDKKKFLFGEAMGGAVAIVLHRKYPTYWDGAVLVAPMCKIAQEAMPSRVVFTILDILKRIVPKWKLVPTRDLIEISYKSEYKRNEVRTNPFCYTGRLRLKTACQLVDLSKEVESHLDKVSLPFLVVHGGDDLVTDPSVSKLLYETSSSKDKEFKLYLGMWHALTSGELPENVDRVFADVTAWLNKRSRGPSSHVKEEKKHV